MALLEVRNIDVFYGDVQAIFDLSLRVEQGKVVSIIGGNGAGKSTLLKTISGLMQPVKGEIVFDGKPIQSLPPEAVVERGIVQVPEGRRLFTLMSVQDNLIVGAYSKRADVQKENTFRRRAANGGHRAWPHGEAQDPDARRAFPGAGPHTDQEHL